jgi:hypothetical protein
MGCAFWTGWTGFLSQWKKRLGCAFAEQIRRFFPSTKGGLFLEKATVPGVVQCDLSPTQILLPDRLFLFSPFGGNLQEGLR